MSLQFVALIPLFLASVSGNTIITSPSETNFGDWGVWQRCPFGTYAQGLQVKTEPFQGIIDDDTALNAIRLYCGDPNNATTAYITSTESSWGQWGDVVSCRSDNRPLPPDGYVVGFQLRVEPYLGSADDTATNNVRIFCSFPESTGDYQLEADGLAFGSWTTAQKCGSNQAVCALQTQVERYQGDDDDTALNNISAECCDRF